MNRKTILIYITFLAVFISSCAHAEKEITAVNSDRESFQLIQVTGNLVHPWGMDFLPDGDILITELRGKLFRYTSGSLSEVTGIPDVAAVGQGGLLDIAVHPDFTVNQLVYFTYSTRFDGGAGTALGRGRLEGNRLRNTKEIFRMNKASSTGHHFGSRIVFGPEGYIYMSIGDRGERNRAQDTQDHAGSVLRLRDDGSPTPDNPWREEERAVPELFTIGHRNIQGMAVHPRTGRIWTHEHGPRGGDEINILTAGKNYGWPLISYGDEYGSGRPVGPNSAPGLEQPLLYWKPSIAPSGMTFYTGDHFPGWEGDLFAGALAGQHLRRVRIRNGSVTEEEILLQGAIGRIRDVSLGPDGKLYLLTDERNGGLFRIDPR